MAEFDPTGNDFGSKAATIGWPFRNTVTTSPSQQQPPGTLRSPVLLAIRWTAHLRIVQVAINENVGRPDAEAPIEVGPSSRQMCATATAARALKVRSVGRTSHRADRGKRDLPRPPNKTRTNHDQGGVPRVSGTAPDLQSDLWGISSGGAATTPNPGTLMIEDLDELVSDACVVRVGSSVLPA